MAQQTINIGAVANDGTGDPARTAFGKANGNFDELYSGKLDATIAAVGAVLHPLTAAEIAAGVVPVHSQYEPYHVYRYDPSATPNATPGTTDMTTAVQTALNVWTNRRTAIASGEVILPEEGLLITRPLVYAGSSGHSLKIRGVKGGSRHGNAGSYLKWGGTAGGSMMILSGANETVFEDFNFVGNTGSGITQCLHVSADNIVNTTLTGAIAAGAGVVATPASMAYIAVGSLLGVGAGGADIEHVYVTAVTGTTFTADFLNAHASGAQVGGSSGSSGVMMKNMHYTIPAGALTCGVLYGNETGATSPQIDDGRFEHIRFQGSGTPGDAYAGVRIIGGGNVLNFYFNNSTFYGTKRGVSSETFGGALVLFHPQFLNITEDDIVSANTVAVTGAYDESNTAHRFLSGNAGSNYISATLIGNYFNGSVAKDYIIDFNGALTLIGNTFRNGAAVAKIRSASLMSGIGSEAICSIGNFYENATEIGAVFYNSTNAIRYDEFAGINKLRLFSMNDLGGVAGAHVPLTPMFPTLCNFNAKLSNQDMSAGLTVGAIGAVTRTYQTVVIPYTAFQAAALTKDLTTFTVPVRSKIVGIYADTTVAFAGPAGTLNLRVGSTSGGQELLLDHDVKTAAVTKGLADADLGASITRAAAIQGGTVTSWGANTDLYTRLTSSSGNLDGLTAGSVTLYVLVERML